MERETISRRDFLKAAAVGVIGLVVKSSADAVFSDNLTKDYDIEPVTLPTETTESEFLTSGKIVEFPKKFVEQKLSPAQIREKQVKSELSNILKIMSEHPRVFSKKKKEDIKIYYPIYRAVADKYKLDWYLLFIVHEAETGASSGKRGFVPDAQYQGAMQLDRNTWSDDYIQKATKGLKYLAKLPQRHSDDWEQIAAGGKILGANIRKYKRLGKEEAVLNALLLYSSDEQALKRFRTYKQYEKLFPAKKKRTNRNLALQRVS